jgi:hypothetical protein
MTQNPFDRPKDVHVRVEDRQHPIGTLAIVGAYGALFVLGWLLVYFFLYLPRGPVTQ